MKGKILLPLLMVMLTAAGCDQFKKDEGQKPAARVKKAALVTLVEAGKGDFPYRISAVGTVEPSETVNVVSRVGGELKEILIKDGDMVKKDQLLFVIDQTMPRLTLDKAEAKLAYDRQSLVKAESDLSKTNKLFKQGHVASSAYEDARLGVQALRMQLKVDEITVREAKQQIEYCEIRSPIDGRAGAVKIDAGNLVAAGAQPLVTIDNTRPVEINFSVPDRYIDDLRHFSADGDLKVLAELSSGQKTEGRLTYIGNVDKISGTLPLKAVFDNAEGSLWAGQFIRLELEFRSFADAITVPSRSVLIGTNGNFVFAVDDNMVAHMRPVVTGSAYDGYTRITEGLSEGEKVVYEGHVRVTDGITVRTEEAVPSAKAE